MNKLNFIAKSLFIFNVFACIFVSIFTVKFSEMMGAGNTKKVTLG